MTATPILLSKVVTVAWQCGEALSRITACPGFKMGNRNWVKNARKTALVKVPSKHIVVSKPAADKAPMVLSRRPLDVGFGPNAR